MKRGALLLAAAWSFAAQAQTQPITASLLAFQCKHVADPNAATAQAALSMCTFVLRGFVDGLGAGASRGARVAFIDDSQNAATSKGIDDLQFRLSLVRPKAHCLPPAATLNQVAEVFVRFVDAHPERGGENYRDPLVDAVEAYFCPR